ncbi:MAG: ATP-binding cassette domain-containing protein [Synergistaceae bacterium]|nr:ATP-binding cassette domain-containing protein [Synergistaceae bacterium]
MSAAIKVENLGKKYFLTHQTQELLYNVLANRLRWAGRKLIHPFARDAAPVSNVEEFWALRGLSLDIQEGERVGIIGRNGAGKSTLFKLLSRITEPTEGRISLRGRVASLLEVGTGFHPELTGRENIYLNGAILGMRRAEIRKNFDAIVDFAGVEKFLDTPVKRYSSGMYVRLAFAVAAHLETEIMMVDEVLSVGDAEFQKKCMGKMDEVSHRAGRTILFVSHNMAAISRLCNRVVYMGRGCVELDTTDVAEGVRRYLSASQESKAAEWRNPGGEFENPWFKPLRFGVYRDGQPVSVSVERGDTMWVEIEGIAERQNPALCVGYALYTEDGTPVYWSWQTDAAGGEGELPPLKGHVCLRAPMPLNLLNLGGYRARLTVTVQGQPAISNPGYNAPSVSFDVTGLVNASPYCFSRRPGSLAVNLPWEVSAL